MKYRAEIDGLRAIAVVAVILFHCNFEFFKGGYLGVDIFFVISGYLISAQITSDLKSRKFNLSDFYIRRARRILPALFCLMLVCLPIAWLLLTPIFLKDFGQSLVSTTGFFSNFLFWKENGYFERLSELKPLLHTWSLSVEEQFYLLYPLCTFLFWRIGYRWLVKFILLIFFFSLLANILSLASTKTLFFLAPFRIWELLTGVLVAFVLNREKRQNLHFANEALSILGLGLIGYCILAFDPFSLAPFDYTLLAVFGSALIILFCKPDTFLYKLLSIKPLVNMGLISYGVYLWHYPILSFSRHAYKAELSSFLSVFLCMLSIVPAYFSWKYIELPFRNKSKIDNALFSKIIVIVALLIVLFGIVLHVNNGLANHRWLHLINLISDNHERMLSGNCLLDEQHYKTKGCLKGDIAQKPSFALFGDSHAASIASELAAIFKRNNKSFVQYSKFDCPPIFNMMSSEDPTNTTCKKYSDSVFNQIIERDIKNVILFGRWSVYVHPEHFDGKHNYYIESSSLGKSTTAPLTQNPILVAYQEVIERFLENDVKVFVINPIPNLNENPIDETIMLSSHFEIIFPAPIPYKNFEARNKAVFELFTSLSENQKITLIGDVNVFCPIVPIDIRVCLNNINREFLYFDDNHLTELGAKLLLYEIEKDLFK